MQAASAGGEGGCSLRRWVLPLPPLGRTSPSCSCVKPEPSARSPAGQARPGEGGARTPRITHLLCGSGSSPDLGTPASSSGPWGSVDVHGCPPEDQVPLVRVLDTGGQQVSGTSYCHDCLAPFQTL